jgi:hypothetical protein
VTKQSLATVLLDRGDIAAARPIVDRLRRESPDKPETQYLEALLKARTGEPFPIRAWLDRYRAVYSTDAGYCVNIAEVLALNHQDGEAVRWLKRAGELGLYSYPFLANNPLYDTLHGDPDFRLYLDVVRRRWERTKELEIQNPLMPAETP